MERRQVCAAVGFVAASLLAGCGDRASPVSPTQTAVAALESVFSLAGRVTDTAYRPVAGSRVEVTTGSRAGTVATTDDGGRFSMPGTFAGTIAVVASKDGYVSATQTVPLRPVPPPSSGEGRWEIAVYLQPLGAAANITGEYTLTLTADSACANLPAAARTRTYRATIVSGARSFFLARLSDAAFFSTEPCPAGRLPDTCTYNQFGIGVAGDYASIGVAIVERLGETSYLVVGAGAAGSFDALGITAPLTGQLLYCNSQPVLVDQGTWACPASTGVACDSQSHQLALVRR